MASLALPQPPMPRATHLPAVALPVVPSVSSAAVPRAVAKLARLQPSPISVLPPQPDLIDVEGDDDTHTETTGSSVPSPAQTENAEAANPRPQRPKAPKPAKTRAHQEAAKPKATSQKSPPAAAPQTETTSKEIPSACYLAIADHNFNVAQHPADVRVRYIFQEATYSSFAEFKENFEHWKTVNGHPFRTASSETLREPDGRENTRFKYRYIVFHCAHYGKPRRRGNGKRPNQSYLPCGCHAMLRLNYSFTDKLLRVTTLNAAHNHKIAPTHSAYLMPPEPKMRKLDDTDDASPDQMEIISTPNELSPQVFSSAVHNVIPKMPEAQLEINRPTDLSTSPLEALHQTELQIEALEAVTKHMSPMPMMQHALNSPALTAASIASAFSQPSFFPSLLQSENNGLLACMYKENLVPSVLHTLALDATARPLANLTNFQQAPTGAFFNPTLAQLTDALSKFDASKMAMPQMPVSFDEPIPDCMDTDSDKETEKSAFAKVVRPVPQRFPNTALELVEDFATFREVSEEIYHLLCTTPPDEVHSRMNFLRGITSGWQTANLKALGLLKPAKPAAK